MRTDQRIRLRVGLSCRRGVTCQRERESAVDVPARGESPQPLTACVSSQLRSVPHLRDRTSRVEGQLTGRATEARSEERTVASVRFRDARHFQGRPSAPHRRAEWNNRAAFGSQRPPSAGAGRVCGAPHAGHGSDPAAQHPRRACHAGNEGRSQMVRLQAEVARRHSISSPALRSFVRGPSSVKRPSSAYGKAPSRSPIEARGRDVGGSRAGRRLV